MAIERGKRAVTLKQAVALMKVLNEWDSVDLQASESAQASSSSTPLPVSGSQQARARGSRAEALVKASSPQSILLQGKRKQEKLVASKKKLQLPTASIMMKVCMMRRVRLRYERDSTLKRIILSKSDTWPQVKAKIAGAFDRLPFESGRIVISDAELEIGPSIPTFGHYLNQFHAGGRTIIGLCIDDDYNDHEESASSSGARRMNLPKTNVASKQGTLSSNSSLSLPSTSSGPRRFQNFQCSETMPMPTSSSSSVEVIESSSSGRSSPGTKSNSCSEHSESNPGLDIMVYSLNEIKAATSDFLASNRIGSGAFGEVYQGYLRHTKVAIKCVKDMESEGVTTVDMEEVAYLSKYRHPHIVQILGICTHKDQPAIVMELMEGGSLFTHLHVQCDLPFIRRRIQILDDAAHGLAYLHCSGVTSKPLLHLDVKSSNILLDLYYRAKVADFGLSKPMPPLPPEKSYVKVTSFRGTRGYTADEYLDGELSTKLDVFSFGVVVVETYSGKKGYDPQRPTKRLVDMARDALYDLEEFIKLRDPILRGSTFPDMELQALCKKMLASRSKRIEMAEVLKILQGIRTVYKI